jgi:ubiquinone biosynthesis protein
MVAVKSEHLVRYRDIAWLLWKHGRADWVRASGLDKNVKEKFQDNGGGPDTLAADLESLGPTFVKIGQLLSSRADLLPPAYLEALSRLQDDVEPVSFEQIEEVLYAELAARPSRIFSEINPLPLAAASLAQVHAATLRDGRDVVVKVQRPGIVDEIQRDIEIFFTMARLGTYTAYGRKYHVEDVVKEFKQTIEAELDYRLEVDNLLTLRRNLAQFKRLQIPVPIEDFSTQRVLTMERISGASISSISPVVFTEVDGAALAEELLEAYLKQILDDGFFHADPHPGNIFLTHDHRIGLIDLGMVGRIDSELQQNFIYLLIAISEGRGRDAAEIALRIGEVGRDFRRQDFIERVAYLVQKNENATMRNIEAGRMMLEIQHIAGDAQLHLPRATALVGKTLLNLDAVARCLAPNFNPNASIRRHNFELINRRLRQRMRPSNLLQSMMETAEIASQLPRRVNDLLTQMGKSGIRLDVDAFDEKTFVSGFQKVANRIAAGLILAALIIGAALLMRIDTAATLFGYPAFAIILFLAAALGAIILLIQIMVADHRNR